MSRYDEHLDDLVTLFGAVTTADLLVMGGKIYLEASAAIAAVKASGSTAKRTRKARSARATTGEMAA